MGGVPAFVDPVVGVGVPLRVGVQQQARGEGERVAAQREGGRGQLAPGRVALREGQNGERVEIVALARVTSTTITINTIINTTTTTINTTTITTIIVITTTITTITTTINTIASTIGTGNRRVELQGEVPGARGGVGGENALVQRVVAERQAEHARLHQRVLSRVHPAARRQHRTVVAQLPGLQVAVLQTGPLQAH